MKALVFAAGRGERMRPLTDQLPKPLLQAGGRSLLEWHLLALAAAGIREVVVNTSWCAHRFEPAIGDGAALGVRVHWLHEGPEPLETGGGMLNALPLLGPEPFLAVNGDIHLDFDLSRLPREPSGLAHLLMVPNPAHHPDGDFVLGADGRLGAGDGPRLTFAGVGVYRPQLLADWRAAFAGGGGDGAAGLDATPPRFRLAPVLRAAMVGGAVTGQRFDGRWTDVGTPQRLEALDRRLGGSGLA
ncbi:MAG: N-acetylmuramate alpha-1-phosphate uridylyltransferase MurU [Lysobacteraceae bacterium]